MSKTKALNKTITTVLILLITVSILSVINITPVYAAMSIDYMSLTSGPVGTTVILNGTIDTYAGAYKIYFDSDGSNVGEADEVVDSGNAVGTSVDTTFTVPDSINGTRTLWLHDVTSGANATANFVVGTTYSIAVTPTVGQEDYTNFTITASVTGGTAADIPIEINVTKPDNSISSFTMDITTDNDWGNGTATMSSQTAITNEYIGNLTDLGTPYLYNFTNIPAVDGSESFNTTQTHTPYYNGTGFVGVNFTTAPAAAELTAVNYTYLNFTTPYCGTYTASLNVSSVTDTFEIIITNATTYNRGEVVELRSTGWPLFTEQRLNFTVYKPDDTIANTTLIWVNASAPLRTANYTWAIPLDAPLGTYNVTVTNATGTAKPVLDTSTFTVPGTGALTFTNVTYPTTPYMRTQTAEWVFNITYPDSSNFTLTNSTGIRPVYVYRNGTQIATATGNYMYGGQWNATWNIPVNAVLGSGYNFTIPADSWNDTLGNSGPPALFTSSNFTISLADLAVTWYNSTLANYNATATPKSWQNRTLWQNCTLRVTYPNGSVLTDSLTSVLNATVWNSTHTVANLTYAAGDVTYDSGTGNWTVKWHIPYNVYNATDQSRYAFCLLANFAEDNYGNKGPTTSQNSTEFKVTSAVITVPSISTTQSSYARGTTVTVNFTAEYPGSPVTTGKATITLTMPDASTTTVYATYSAGTSRFQATYYLDFGAQLGTWTATLDVNALNDTRDVTPRWYPGNLGPATAVNTTFTVTESSLLLQINATVTDLEAKLDNSTFGLNAIKTVVDQVQTAVNQVQTTLNAVGTKVDAIYAEVTNSTYGLSALKTLLDAIKAKTDTINWADITSIKTAVTHVSTRKFDFGTSTSLWEPGFVQVTPSTNYTAAQGYGWTNTTGLYARDRGAPDDARKDFVFSSLNRTFQVDLTNGDYTVIVTLGDQSYSHDNMTITVEGNSATVDNAAGTFVQKVFHVTVTDGSLTVTMKDTGGVDANWVINTLIIEQSWK